MVCETGNESCRYFENGKCTFEEKPKPRTIAVDLDGTILEYDGWKGHSHFGKPLPGAKEALQKLKEQGFLIIIWTTRNNKEEIARYLREQGIPFDYINENPFGPPDGSNKIYADYYVDDKAVEFRGDWQEVLRKVCGAKTDLNKLKEFVNNIVAEVLDGVPCTVQTTVQIDKDEGEDMLVVDVFVKEKEEKVLELWKTISNKIRTAVDRELGSEYQRLLFIRVRQAAGVRNRQAAGVRN